MWESTEEISDILPNEKVSFYLENFEELPWEQCINLVLKLSQALEQKTMGKDTGSYFCTFVVLILKPVSYPPF